MKTDKELVGGYAPDFELPGIDKQVYHLGRYLEQYKAIAVIFISNQCPVVNQYLDRIQKIQADFNPQGFSFIAINSNDSGDNLQESFESMALFAQKHNLLFPYLRDPTQDVAKSFGIKVTPEVFLLDNKSVIRYAGSIDGEGCSRLESISNGARSLDEETSSGDLTVVAKLTHRNHRVDDNPDAPDLVTKSYLRDSITNLLSAQEISITYTEPIGTPIQWRNK